VTSFIYQLITISKKDFFAMLQLDFSRYLQQSIFQASILSVNNVNNVNDIIIGKTTTLVEGSHYLPLNQSAKFLAFNKHIVAELKARLPKNIKSSTIHGLGYSSLKRYYPKAEVNANKYNRLCRQYLADRNITKDQDYDSLCDLVRLAQVNLINPSNLQEIKDLCLHYTIPIKDNWSFWQEAVNDILSKGIELARQEISFDDMIWLPNLLDLPVINSDWLFIDECQDLNQAQLQLVLKAHKHQTRSLFVGDKFQAIMAFSGADSSSIDNIIVQTNAIQLPLSISYRLPISHVELANKLFNVIEPAEGAINGILDKIDTDDIGNYVNQGDLIICRCFYPLVPVYFSLIRQGIPCCVKNKDISTQLTSLLKTVFGKKNQILSFIQFETKLQKYYQEVEAELIKTNKTFLLISLHDKIKTLKVIYETRKCQSLNDCINVINEFSKEAGGNPINLSTIHSAKGLEAKQVFILRPDLMPHYLAKQDWEKIQEKNLMFVALTRSKESLFFCT